MKMISWKSFFRCLCLRAADGWKGKAVKVLDGDTLHVKKGRKIIKIRLYGIDCPEKRQKCGVQATEFATQRLLGKKVRVETVHTDRYGRTVGLVSVGRKMINRELVRAGYAWVYPAYCKKQPLCAEFTTLQEKAKKKKAGLWRQKRPVAPWEWRRKKTRR